MLIKTELSQNQNHLLLIFNTPDKIYKYYYIALKLHAQIYKIITKLHKTN